MAFSADPQPNGGQNTLNRPSETTYVDRICTHFETIFLRLLLRCAGMDLVAKKHIKNRMLRCVYAGGIYPKKGVKTGPNTPQQRVKCKINTPFTFGYVPIVRSPNYECCFQVFQFRQLAKFLSRKGGGKAESGHNRENRVAQRAVRIQSLSQKLGKNENKSLWITLLTNFLAGACGKGRGNR